MKRPINLDSNASYGLLAEVQNSLISSHELMANPSSVHSAGQKLRASLERARDSVRRFLGAGLKDRIVFTSGATEANNAAIMYPVWKVMRAGDPLQNYSAIASSIEHPSVLEPLIRLEQMGLQVYWVYPRNGGAFEPEQFAEHCSEKTLLVSAMLANNETGQILPVRKIFDACRERAPHAVMHCDAVQALGKRNVVFGETGADILTVSAHKIGGLTGCGAMLVKDSLVASPFIVGGPQESRWRAGTENIPGILSFGAAVKHIQESLGDRITAFADNRRYLFEALRKSLNDIELNYDSRQDVLPNTINLWIPGVRSDDLTVALDLHQVFASAGAACSSGKQDPSHVLLAMGYPERRVRESIRLSVRAEQDREEMEEAAARIIRCVERLRGTRRAA